jgi:chemotaxis regulatin CheY-phosphate phosphatase CheZ
MDAHFRDVLDSIRESLSDADEHTTISASQISNIIIASKQLTSLVERLYKRILDLERVQNERASESS